MIRWKTFSKGLHSFILLKNKFLKIEENKFCTKGSILFYARLGKKKYDQTILPSWKFLNYTDINNKILVIHSFFKGIFITR